MKHGAHNFKDMTGQRFGKLVVVRYEGYKPGSGQWLCQCDCGRESVVGGANLRRGKTRSCGCATGDFISKAIARHGDARYNQVSREHRIWRGMLTRCNNPNRKSYEYYGARGIKVCERWQSFENFLSDMGRAPEGHSIDRIDVNGDYEPGNCRWADAKTQSKNRRPRRWYRRPV